jgi:hypothetical protein
MKIIMLICNDIKLAEKIGIISYVITGIRVKNFILHKMYLNVHSICK